MRIPFNKPYMTGDELQYIKEAVVSGHISGNGIFTGKCHDFFKKRYDFKKVLLTTSCTDALEMAAILVDIQPGDEVIMPAYTFVSTANAFVLRGAEIVFCDSDRHRPNMNAQSIESLITEKTKAIVPVHYAGVACDMDLIMKLADKYGVYVIEDAAQCIDSFYKGKPLGGIGHFGAFSFHETKNVISGEGGLLVVNDERFFERSEIIWEKGTNRSAFFRGDVNKYGWVDIGSSFLPSDIIGAFLFAQLEHLDEIQSKRSRIWNYYYDSLKELQNKGYVKLPVLSECETNNAHMFYMLTENESVRDRLIGFLNKKSVLAVFHYLSLHKSEFYKDRHDGRNLKNSDMFTKTLIRLPLYFELEEKDLDYVIENI